MKSNQEASFTGLRSLQRGFTLIELMIVVAIIGVLAAIAIPAYQNYTIRAQVTDGLALVQTWKTGIEEYYANTGSWASTSDLSMVNSTGKYEISVKASTGQIEVRYGIEANVAINGAFLYLTPYVDNAGDVIWRCGNAMAPASATLPTGVPYTATTVSPQYLPAACRN